MKVNVKDKLASVETATRMNREQKRRLAKQYGVPMSYINSLMSAQIKDVKWDKFTDDSKVKLKYDRIMEHADEYGEKYIEWVNAHKDMELTAYQDEDHKDSSLYCMREDTNQSPWLFDISDLELVEMKGATGFTTVKPEENTESVTEDKDAESKSEEVQDDSTQEDSVDENSVGEGSADGEE